jgi:hypothetical protein
MTYLQSLRRPLVVSFAAACLTATWWGCSASSDQHGPTTSSSSSGTGGTGGTTTGPGASDAGTGDGAVPEAGACVSTSVAGYHVPLDLIFVIDTWNGLAGTDWTTITNALKTFFNDPASANVGVGLLLFPYSPGDCYLPHYETLTVPIDQLPKNAFALTNALPAAPDGDGSPARPALHGALLQATAWQDANPTHRVAVVYASPGDLKPAVPGASDANECGDTSPLTVYDKLAELASGALSYDGVRTFIVGVSGAILSDLDEVAAAGGTTAAFDANNISKFASAIAQIRTVGLGCDYAIPTPPNNMQLNFDKVNFTYTPSSTGVPTLLPRAKDLADCGGTPGWYYDNNSNPSEIVLCPASCSVVEADDMAKVSVDFGCESVFK